MKGVMLGILNKYHMFPRLRKKERTQPLMIVNVAQDFAYAFP